MELAGKCAVVTGASRGIGKAIALRLAAAGMDVLVCARSEHQSDPNLHGTIVETAEQIRRLGGRGVAHRADLADTADVRSVIDRARLEFGRVDVLVNNAVHIGFGSILEAPADELDTALAVNLRAPYLAAKLVLPLMISQGGGAIINITAPGARPAPVEPAPENAPPSPFRFPIHPGYGISKIALEAFTNRLAHETAPHAIGVIAVEPQFVDTEMARWLLRPDFDASGMHSPDLIARVVAEIARNPMAHSGEVVSAQDFAA
ncbi:SDR family NAD(P)-dependent oxidoreductase [Amycolatopsis pigmentata]